MQGEGFCAWLAKAVQQQAHPPRASAMLRGQCLQARVNGSGLPGVAKVLRRLGHTGQMLCLMAIDTIDSARVSSTSNGSLARARKACLCSHSCHSAPAAALAVIPLPMLQRAWVPRITTVRMGTLKVAAMPPLPSGRTTPMAPQ